MHDREYEYLTAFNTVEHAIRETVYKAPPNIFFYDRPGIGIIHDVPHSGKDLDRKIIAETGFSIFLMVNSCNKLFFHLRVK